jgi:hypothetical protein
MVFRNVAPFAAGSLSLILETPSRLIRHPAGAFGRVETGARITLAPSSLDARKGIQTTYRYR